MKNTSLEPKRRSNWIAPKLEFSNTRDDPIGIVEAERERSVQREEIGFIEDESKKQDSLMASEGGHSSNDLSKSEEGHFSAGQGSIGQTSLAILPSVPPVNTFIFFLFISFQVPYLCLSQVSPWSTLHLEAGAVPSLYRSFLDQTTPYVKPPSRPPIDLDVAVAYSTISHLLSLNLLSLSIVQKNAFHATMAALQFASLKPETRAFIYGVIKCALKVFSSIEDVVKEDAQVIFKLEELRGKKSKYEQSKLSTY